MQCRVRVVGRTVRFLEQEIIVSKYSIGIDFADEHTSEVESGPIVSAVGSFKLISAAAKEGLAAIKGQQDVDFVATVVELSGEGREVVRVRATEDIVTLVVNKRLKDEKAQNAGATPVASGQTGYSADQADIAAEEAAAAS
jgi:hypothetical protein